MDPIRDLMARRFAACQLLAKAFGCNYAIEYHPECFSDNE
jgi:hypothetical protein